MEELKVSKGTKAIASLIVEIAMLIAILEWSHGWAMPFAIALAYAGLGFAAYVLIAVVAYVLLTIIIKSS